MTAVHCRAFNDLLNEPMQRGTQLTVLILFGALALAIGVGAGLWFTSRTPAEPLEISGIYLPDGKELNDFTLISQDEKPFTRADLQGHWTFVYVGYTFCPDACPMTLGYLNAMQQKLVAQNPAAEAETDYLLISVDPKRDTPARLGEYTAYYNPKFHGATGDPDELNRLARQLGVVYAFPDGQEGEFYTVDHSSTVLLFDPAGRLRAVLTPPHNPEVMAADFLKIREYYQRHG